MKFNPFFLQFLSNFKYIRYTTCTQTFNVLLYVSWNSARWKVQFQLELKLVSVAKFRIACPTCVKTDIRDPYVIL